MCRCNRRGTLQQVLRCNWKPEIWRCSNGFSARAREWERERERSRSLGISAWARNPLTMAPLNGDLSADSGALMLTVRRPLTKSTMPRQPWALILIYRRFHVNSAETCPLRRSWPVLYWSIKGNLVISADRYVQNDENRDGNGEKPVVWRNVRRSSEKNGSFIWFGFGRWNLDHLGDSDLFACDICRILV